MTTPTLFQCENLSSGVFVLLTMSLNFLNIKDLFECFLQNESMITEINESLIKNVNEMKEETKILFGKIVFNFSILKSLSRSDVDWNTCFARVITLRSTPSVRFYFRKNVSHNLINQLVISSTFFTNPNLISLFNK